MRDEDLERVFQYIGGIIRDEGGIPFVIGGVADHIHILTTLPKTVALSDFVRNIKAKSSKWLKRWMNIMSFSNGKRGMGHSASVHH